MCNIRWLEDICRRDITLVGGKAVNLSILLKDGVCVPDGFVITTRAFDSFLQKEKLEETINEVVNNLNPEEFEELKSTSKRIKHLFLRGKLPSPLLEKVEKIYKELKANSVVCRSSSTFEDAPSVSFAGQHETFLNVDSFEALKERIRKCWASLYTPRALSYAYQKDIDMRKGKMAVIVQQMIEPNKSGVMFTSHPTKESNKILIEATQGLGKDLVSGDVTPQRFVVNSENLNIKRDTKNPEEASCSPLLSKNEIRRLVTLGKRIAKLFESPQDIEWAIKEDQIHILQSRAITA